MEEIDIQAIENGSFETKDILNVIYCLINIRVNETKERAMNELGWIIPDAQSNDFKYWTCVQYGDNKRCA